MGSSQSNEQCPSPRFYDYLNGLREEFDLQSNPTLASSSSPRHFNIYLEGVRCEFELMAEDIESLRKKRDELEAKVEAQAMELRNARNNVVCQRCSRSTDHDIASSPLNFLGTILSSSFAPVVQSESLQKPNTFSPVTPPAGISRNIASSPLKTSGSVPSSSSLPKANTSSSVVKPSQQNFPSSTQNMTVARKPHNPITPTRSSQSVSDAIVAHSQSVIPASPLQQASTSTLNADSGPAERDSSTKSNDGVGKEIHLEVAHVLSHEDRILRIKFSQDGKYLAAGGQDGKVYLYEVQTGTLIRILRNLLAEYDLFKVVCFSRDGKYLATGSNEKGIYIWEIKTKIYVRNAFQREPFSIRSLDFSPDGRLLVSTSEGNSVCLWSMRDGVTKELTNGDNKFSGAYTSAVFSPSGRHVAASSNDGIVRLWRARTGQLMRQVVAHMHIAFDVRFMPDGKGLVSGGETLKYWDITSWDPTFPARLQTGHLDRSISAQEETQPEREYSGHSSSVHCVAISPDGQWIASGSLDNTVRIWDSRTGAVQCSLDHNYQVHSVDFCPASHYVASGEGDGTVKIWRYSHKPPSSRSHEVADDSYDGFWDEVFLNCLDEVELLRAGERE